MNAFVNGALAGLGKLSAWMEEHPTATPDDIKLELHNCELFYLELGKAMLDTCKALSVYEKYPELRGEQKDLDLDKA